MAALELSSVDQVKTHLRLPTAEIDDDLTQALDAARDLISSDVVLGATQAIPKALHRAAMLLAAQLWRQAETVEGDDRSYTGVPMGPRLMYDPQIRDLLRPYLRHRVGAAQRLTDSQPVNPAAGTAL